MALSDYSLFKGAERAVIINSEGKQMPVDAVLGANDMYDVIKFRVAITEKKVPALTVATVAPAVGAEAYLLPYSTQKDRTCTQGKVKKVTKIEDNYSYYTLDMRLKDKMVSCPVADANGQVFGLAQKRPDRILPVSVMQPVPLSLCRKASAHCRSAILHCGTLV